MKPSIAIVLDTRRKIIKGENKDRYHIKLRVTFKVRVGDVKKWIKKMYLTGIYATPEEFQKIRNNPRTTEHRAASDSLFKLEKKARGIIENNTYINEDIFERQLTGSGGHDNVFSYFQVIIDENQRAGSAGNAAVYSSAMNSFKRFTEIDYLSFYEITKKWLEQYARWIGGKHTALSMNLRCLRAVFNRAITEERIPADIYPFARNTHDRTKFRITSVVGSKHAMDESQLARVFNFQSSDPMIVKAVDFLRLSFLCYGINAADLLRLRFRDIENDTISLLRHKTRNTNKVVRKIIIPLPAEASEIIFRYSNKSLNPDSYIFPVLRDGMTPKQELSAVHDFEKMINNNLRKVGSSLKLPFKLTFYVARHTFATLSLIRGASLTFVMEALGHTSPKTTLNYFHGFDIGTKKRISGLISST